VTEQRNAKGRPTREDVLYQQLLNLAADIYPDPLPREVTEGRDLSDINIYESNSRYHEYVRAIPGAIQKLLDEKQIAPLPTGIEAPQYIFSADSELLEEEDSKSSPYSWIRWQIIDPLVELSESTPGNRLPTDTVFERLSRVVLMKAIFLGEDEELEIVINRLKKKLTNYLIAQRRIESIRQVADKEIVGQERERVLQYIKDWDSDIKQ
jgi:hypothetical protein